MHRCKPDIEAASHAEQLRTSSRRFNKEFQWELLNSEFYTASLQLLDQLPTPEHVPL